MMKIQNIDDKGPPFLVTLNPPRTPKHTMLKWTTGHPIPSVAASKASLELNQIQGKRGIWFCGAYQGSFILVDYSYDMLDYLFNFHSFFTPYLLVLIYLYRLWVP